MNSSREMDSSFFAAAMNDLSFKEESQNSVLVFDIHFRGAMIVLLNHPASVTVYKYVSVEVLSGSVSVLGHEITLKSPPLEIFSSEKTGLIEIKTETCERIWRKIEYTESLNSKIFGITNSKQKTREIMKQVGNLTVAIFVKRIAFPVNIQLLELYYPQVVEFNLQKKNKKKKEMIILPKGQGIPLQFGENEEKLAIDISQSFRDKVVGKVNGPRILVCGPKKTGKSTLLRYLVNKMFSVYINSCYLDTDPGQTEFGPPGTVSLTKVTKPIIGPPFLNQEKPIKMMFTGSVSPSFLDMYSQNVSRLMDLYFEKYAKQPLFVNTMGWMEGTGLQCLANTINVVKPTILIEIVAEDEISMFDYRNYLPEKSHYFQVSCSREQTATTNITPAEMRDFKLISHLGSNISEFFSPMLLNEMTPYCVSWNEIPIYIFPGGNVFAPRMIEAVNQSIVALCSVPESVIIGHDVTEFPRSLENEPENECLAYGLVKAVNEKEHLLYIVSPLKSSEWRNVNAIIKGNIKVPDELILKQEIYDVPLPYTDERDNLPPDNVENNEDDSAMVSLKFLNAVEPPADRTTPYASAPNYHKKISRKHYKSPKGR